MKAPALVVPWMTRWSAEVVNPETIWLTPGLTGVRYRDQRASDRHLGVLWARELDYLGRGEPLWREVHSRRQRRAMLDPRCQVCGIKLPKTNIPWLLPRDEFDNFETGTTITAPTCETCWPIAEARCPHLRRGGLVRLRVAKAIPWGILGGLYHPLRREPQVVVQFGDTFIPHMIAKQLAVSLKGMTVL